LMRGRGDPRARARSVPGSALVGRRKGKQAWISLRAPRVQGGRVLGESAPPLAIPCRGDERLVWAMLPPGRLNKRQNERQQGARQDRKMEKRCVV
jgi:hypothetical protein